MKKLVLVFAVGAFLLSSCSSINVEEATKDFCACADKTGDEKSKCHDEWIAKYKGKGGSEEDGEKLAKGMMECDMSGTVEVLPKLEEK